MKPTLEDILKRAKIHPQRVKGCFIFGSQVYGTADANSDWDIKLVANGTVSGLEIRSGLYNIHIITPADFQKQLNDCIATSVECFLAPDEFILMRGDFTFNPKMGTLRHSFSHTSSNSWVKAKKKMIQNDYQIAIKSMFHSIRIPMFGSQIAKYGRITEWSIANDIWTTIKNNHWDWERLDGEMRTIRLNVMSQFRLDIELKVY